MVVVTPSGARMPDVPAATKSSAQVASHTDATLANAHAMFVSVGIMVAFVVVMTFVAGAGPSAGKASVGIMFLLLLLQGISHVNPIASFMAQHPLTPQQ